MVKKPFAVFRFWFLVKNQGQRLIDPKTKNEERKTKNE